MITHEHLIKHGYKLHNQKVLGHENAAAFYQKRIKDGDVTKYFINIFKYLPIPNSPQKEDTYQAEA